MLKFILKVSSVFIFLILSYSQVYANCTVNGISYRTNSDTSGTYITLSNLTSRASSWNNSTDLVTTCDVSQFTSMNNAFKDNSTFNQDISAWKVGSVSNFSYMFHKTVSFNQNIIGWDVSNATNLRNMFYRAGNFSQDIRGWDVSNVTNFSLMFSFATEMISNFGATANWNTTPTAAWFTPDTTAPTMAITAAEISDGGTSNDATLSLTFTSSEATTNFVVGDITVGNGTLSSFAATSTTVYTATLTPTASGGVVINVAAGAFTDAASNTNTNTSISWLYDGTAPTLSSVSIASNNSTSTQAVADDVVTLTFTASETIGTPVVTFKSGGDAITDTSITYANSGNVHTAKYTVDTDDTAGSVTYSIAFTDTAGNAGTAVTSGTGNVTFDATAPTMAITASEVSDGGTSNDGTLSLTFTSSEATTNFVVGDITVSGGALSSFAATSSTVYTATFTPSVAGATTIDVAGGAFTDAAGNNNIAATQFNWTYDTTAACTVNGQDYRTTYDTSGTYITLSNLTSRAGSWNNSTDLVMKCDVSQFTSMYRAFRNNSSFNQDISAWDVSNVTNMNGMFQSATSLTSVSFSDTSSVTDMSFMFASTTNLTSVSLSDTSNVTDMSYMFYFADAFNVDISSWNTSKVTNMK
ncbi:BspA family leucine-rich repeat surface protein, partial [Amylibacter sp.]|nr:BspA family leucine-rich repeat surface protein [Amylibacter sp.]